MKNTPHIIVDGYNFIMRTQSINHSDENALLDARETLIRQMIAYRGNSNKRITIVFDGQDLKGITKRHRPAGISVRFSKAPQKADPLILEIMSKATNPRIVTLITSDRPLARLAKGYGCQTLSVEAFNTQSRRPEKQVEYRSKYDVRMSQSEVEEWMKLFNQDDEDDE